MSQVYSYLVRFFAIKKPLPFIMIDDSKMPYFKDLPLWLQRDLLAERSRLIPFEKEHKKNQEERIERKCSRRGYALDPSRGDLSFPPCRRSRRSVGDFSLGYEE